MPPPKPAEQQAQQKKPAPPKEAKPVVTATVVVATQPLRFGTELDASMLRAVPWPASAIPAGAFAKVDDILAQGPRMVLTPLAPNEPVLAAKIAGPVAHPSAILHRGRNTLTIRVGDVEGGAVRPRDRVDVVLTHRTDKETVTSMVVLRDLRVRGVRGAEGRAARAVTLAVNEAQADRLSLAASVGTLSLLRKAEAKSLPKLSMKELAGPTEHPAAPAVLPRPKPPQEKPPRKKAAPLVRPPPPPPPPQKKAAPLVRPPPPPQPRQKVATPVARPKPPQKSAGPVERHKPAPKPRHTVRRHCATAVGFERWGACE